MLLIRGFEDADPDALPARRGLRHDAPLLRAGGDRGRVRERAADGDRVACTYRGHGHALALGADPEALLAEMLGRTTGVNGGRAGSMNIVDLDHGLIGCYGIVGGSIAAATGAALALKGSGRLAVAYFGDGTTNQAYFFECLNFAKVLYAAGGVRLREQRLRRVHADGGRDGGAIIARAESMRDRRRRPVDGMDVCAVREAAARGAPSASAAAAGRSSSRRAPIASSAIRAATPATTGPRASSSDGASATRSRVAARSTARRRTARGDRGRSRPSSSRRGRRLRRRSRSRRRIRSSSEAAAR